MHFPTDWYDRLAVEDGHVVRILKAVYNGKRDCYSEIDVYKERDDGMSCHRNLYCSMWGGYSVAFPGQVFNNNPNSYYYYPEVAEENEWSEWEKVKRNVGLSCFTSEHNHILIENIYPDFKYVVKKYQFESIREEFDKLQMWILHPEIELLLAAKFEKLAMSKRFFRLKPENRKPVLQFCRKHPECYDFTYEEIRACIKSDETEKFLEYYLNVPTYQRENRWSNGITYEEWKYLKRKGWADKDGIDHYIDYKYMLKISDHDENDDYWHFPSNLYKAHDKLLAERRRKEEIRKRELERQRQKQAKKNKDSWAKVTKKYSKYNTVLDGYSIFITDDMEMWNKQAKELHQCIVRCDYMQQVAKRQCLIFFIQKDDVPVATAQVMPGKKINQFYANEIDRDNCRPTQEVQDIFNRFLEKVVVKEAI